MSGMSDFKPYLHSAHIEGYKSIVNCDVTFKPGLNIIIGKNGTGKTNLLEAVRISLASDSLSAIAFPELQSRLILKDSESPYPIEFIIDPANEKYRLSLDREGQLRGARERFKIGNSSHEEYFKKGLYNIGIGLYTPILFTYAIPREIPFLTGIPTGWHVEKNRTSFFPNPLNGYSGFSFLVLSIFKRLSDYVDNSNFEPDKSKAIVTEEMNSFIQRILSQVRSCTKINDIVVSEGLCFENEAGNFYTIKDFRFKFKIGPNAYEFDDLSDGTKRILLIIVESLEANGKIGLEKDVENKRIVLLEEPELGIHPHQLHLLMNFIKEQSQEKQIILTTHSPDVLNILSEDEFDRIIIAEFNSKQGSTFRHLTEAEIQKAKAYVEAGLQISDYWKHSDLEPALN